MSQLRTESAIYSVTLTDANTEYALEIPDGAESLRIQARTDVAVRMAFQRGRVASAAGGPYWTLRGGSAVHEWDLVPRPLTIFFATGSAGTVVEVLTFR